MAETLSTLLQQVYRDTGQSEEFAATGGSTTSVVNSFWGDLDAQPEDTKFKGSYVFVVRDAGGASAAPEGEYQRITAYDGTSTLTTAAFTVAVAAGDWCMFASTRTFPLFDTISAINRGLQDLGYLRVEDTSLTSVASQTEYTIPASLRGRPLWGVWLEGNDDANDNQWIPVNGYKLLDSTTLYIPQLAEGYTIKLGGWGLHSALTAYNSALSVYVPKPLAVASAKVAMLEGFIAKNGDNVEKSWRAMYDEALRQRETFKKELGIWRPQPHRNVLQFGEVSNA